MIESYKSRSRVISRDGEFLDAIKSYKSRSRVMSGDREL